MVYKQRFLKTNSKLVKRLFFLLVLLMKKTWLMNISWSLIKKHLTCMDLFMLDIFILPEELPRFTRSSYLAYMATVLVLFVINKKHSLLDSVTNSKHPDLKSFVLDVKKSIYLNSEV
jgi:hypothetical protein